MAQAIPAARIAVRFLSTGHAPAGRRCRQTAVALSPADEAILSLEEIAGGPLPAELPMGMADFNNLLELHRGRFVRRRTAASWLSTPRR